MRVRATISTDNESLIHYAGQRSATPCTKKVRGWAVGEIKATRALGEHCSESQMQVALHASGACHPEMLPKALQGGNVFLYKLVCHSESADS